MAEKLRLKTGSRYRVRVHIVILAILIIICLGLGFVASQKGWIYGKTAENCIPQKDFQYILDKSNQVYADYQGCVADAWALQLACKMNVASAKAKIAESNLTKTK